MNYGKGCESQRMFAELIFHETSKMDEEIWNSYYLEATQQLHKFRSLQIQKTRERQQALHQFQSPPQHFQPPVQSFRNPQCFQPPTYPDPSLGQKYISPQGQPTQSQQYNWSQSQKSTLQDSQAHVNMPIWSQPQEPSSSSAGPSRKLPSYSTLMTSSDPGATSSLIRQAYDNASHHYTPHGSDPLLNCSGSDLNFSGLLYNLTGASTPKPKSPNKSKPRRNTNDQHTDVSDSE